MKICIIYVLYMYYICIIYVLYMYYIYMYIELYVYYMYYIIGNHEMILKCVFNVFFNDLSRRSKQIERDTYKGGRGALAPRPPL